jgi:uncharacterized protein YbjT (DUF2867 family)
MSTTILLTGATGYVGGPLLGRLEREDLSAAQPIAIDDVLEYLVSAIGVEPTRSAVYEIGGDDQVLLLRHRLVE